MEPYDEQDYNGYYSHSAPRYMSSRNSHYYNNYPPQQYYDGGMPPPPPPPPLLPPNKPKKKSVLKSPLTAIKNALIKGTRPLRRMNSMVEPERKSNKSALKRQHSLLERQMQRPYYPDEFPTYPAGFEQQYREPIYSQQQYYNSYHPHAQYDDYGTYQNLESEDIYGNIPRQRYVPPTTPYENEEIYANRALIDLERRQAVAMSGRNGRAIVRRHSTTTADRQIMRRSPADYKNPMNLAPNSEVMSRRRFYPPASAQGMQALQQLDEPVYQTRREMQREMQRNHLYQSRQEMQQRIQQGKREMEREFSTHSSSSQSEREEPLPDPRQHFKDSASRTRAELREKIYQTRQAALESMAEPIYVSKRDNIKRPEPIYECKEELLLHSRENETDERKKEEKCEVVVEINHEESIDNDVDLQQSSDTIKAAEQTVLPANSETLTSMALAPLVQSEELEDDLVASMEDLQITAVQNSPKLHINQVIQPPLGPPPPPAAVGATAIGISQLSLATQASSIPSGVPNATSTPYTSNMSLPVAGPVNPLINHHELFPASPREAKTTRGVLDCTGGTLSDPTWHVSLQIPAGAIPEGVRQEIYFTVSDPRLGESVGGPPLDMENGETMLSPLVMCGPQGLEFLVPVTLNIPHCAGRTASLGLALKATDSEKQLHTEWDNIDLPSNAAAHTVSVKVDHF